MIEINIADPDAHAAVQIGDVVRYDGPRLVGPGGPWRDLLASQPHPLWAYDPMVVGDNDEPWALLNTAYDYWDRRWGWEDLPPVVTLVLRDGQPAAGDVR